MKFRTDNHGSSIETQQVSLQGYIQATLADLTRAFGAPAVGEPGDRIIACWAIEFEDGSVATIYAWKLSELPEPSATVSWNIGGVTPRVVALIHDAFRETHGLLARAA